MKTKLCKPMLIESKVMTNIMLWPNNQLHFDENNVRNYDRSGTGEYKQIILVSLDPDDTIEVGELCYSISNNTLVTFSNYPLSNSDINYKKLIAWQSQLPFEYIEQYFKEYNDREIKDIELEMELFNGDYKPKLTNGFVTIVNKEINIHNESFELGYKASEKHHKDLKSKMYTEEEVRDLFKAIKMTQEFAIQRNFPCDIVELFEQHKKK